MKDIFIDGKIKVKVYPGAKNNKIKAVREKILHIDIKAQPENNKANVELLKFLKKELKTGFKIKTGHGSRSKVLEVI